jgi:signal transduction histidine kinase
VENKAYRLIALQNVNDTLDEAEVKAWQKLLSVMTHEIMNSVAPISSLADTLKSRLSEETFAKRPDSDLFDDIQVGIDTIGRRSEGLLRFAKAYRNLNKIGEPNLATIYMRDLFENLRLLLQPMMTQKGIAFDIVLSDSALRLRIDVNLIEQALINLLTNAIEAVKDVPSPCISLSASRDNKGKVSLRVTDNGTGIPPELMERIFIPFFSTRKNGSGIGLSLCQQIMLLHKGSVQVHSVAGQGASVGLLF